MTGLPRIDKALAMASDVWPDRCAASFRGERLGYAEMYARAMAMAASLKAAGVRPGDRVAIAMTKGLEMPVAIHAIWAAGAAFVPLDPAAPIERLAGIVKDCAIKVAIGADRNKSFLSQLVAASGVTVVGAVVDCAHCVMPVGATPDITPHENGDDDLAYIIFTSGSTGVPKGICHSFASGTGFAHAWMAQYRLQANDVFFCTVPLHFDFSLADFFCPAMVGASTELVPEQALMFPASIAELLEKSGGTIWSSVPYTFLQLCERGAVETRELSSLRWLIYGVEPMPPSGLPVLRQVFKARISNSYGPAEVNQVSEYTVPDDHPTDRPIPIGQTMQHATFAQAEDGELLVAGGSMMQGYWNRPDLNERVFAVRDGVRFYRTGDRVEQDRDGLWMFIGREDRQIKIRGYRIELDEVEMAMASHPDVSEAAVVVSADKLTLHGFAAPVPGATVTVAEIQTHIGSRLPRYAVPDRIEIRPAFAKTSTGKINRKALTEELS